MAVDGAGQHREVIFCGILYIVAGLLLRMHGRKQMRAVGQQLISLAFQLRLIAQPDGFQFGLQLGIGYGICVFAHTLCSLSDKSCCYSMGKRSFLCASNASYSASMDSLVVSAPKLTRKAPAASFLLGPSAAITWLGFPR